MNWIVLEYPWNIEWYTPLQAVEQKHKSTQVRPVLDYKKLNVSIESKPNENMRDP